MKKYRTEFKLDVVQRFLAGRRRRKVAGSSHYSLHGVDGLRPKRSTYSVQFKLLAGTDREQRSSHQVAAFYDIRNPNQVVVGDAISIKAV